MAESFNAVKPDPYVELRSDQTAKLRAKHGHVTVYYDNEKDEIVIQAKASGRLLVSPRAHNSIALILAKD